jgi:hypothetical protein
MKSIRTAACFAVVGIMMLFFFWGVWRFPDGPIHTCVEHGYCGKQGQPHSRKDFELYDRWETLLVWCWLPGMLTAYLLRPKKAT